MNIFLGNSLPASVCNFLEEKGISLGLGQAQVVADALSTLPDLALIKQQAKQLKVKGAIPHSMALEIVARAHGFRNWQVAQSQLLSAPTPPSSVNTGAQSPSRSAVTIVKNSPPITALKTRSAIIAAISPEMACAHLEGIGILELDGTGRLTFNYDPMMGQELLLSGQFLPRAALKHFKYKRDLLDSFNFRKLLRGEIGANSTLAFMKSRLTAQKISTDGRLAKKIVQEAINNALGRDGNVEDRLEEIEWNAGVSITQADFPHGLQLKVRADFEESFFTLLQDCLQHAKDYQQDGGEDACK